MLQLQPFLNNLLISDEALSLDSWTVETETWGVFSRVHAVGFWVQHDKALPDFQALYLLWLAESSLLAVYREPHHCCVPQCPVYKMD